MKLSKLKNFNYANKLAINGGRPVMQGDEGKFIHPIITPEIEEALIKQAHTTISIYDRSDVFKEFEDAFVDYHDKKYGLVTSSGTTALKGVSSLSSMDRTEAS